MFEILVLILILFWPGAYVLGCFCDHCEQCGQIHFNLLGERFCDHCEHDFEDQGDY